MSSRSAVVAAGCAAVMSLVGCDSSDEAGPVDVVAGHDSDSVTTASGQAPVSGQSGGLDVSEFWSEVLSLPIWETTRPAPPPNAVSDALARSSLVVKADVVDTELMVSRWRPDPGSATVVGKVALRVSLRVEEVLHGEGAEPDGVVYWDVQAWWGDVEALDAAARDVGEHIESDPVGATAVLFLAQSASAKESADGDGSAAWYAVDGMLADDSRRVRLVADGAAAEPERYSSIADLIAAVENLDDGD